MGSSSCPRFFLLSLPGVWHEIRPHLFTMTSVPKLIFLFPISADGRRGLFPLWDSSQSFGFYLLPSPVRRFVRTTICPYTPFFTHPVTECKHLLFSILTRICYFGIDLLSLLTVILWRLANSNTREGRNSLFLFSQWETTWHYWCGTGKIFGVSAFLKSVCRLWCGPKVGTQKENMEYGSEVRKFY